MAKKATGTPFAGGVAEMPHLGVLDDIWQRGGLRNLPLHLVLVAKLIDRYVGGLLARHSSLSLAEWRVVAQLSIMTHGTVRGMARRACVDPAEVSRSAAALVGRGLLRREDNAHDRRSPRFSLTAQGMAEFARFRPHWERLSRTLMMGLEPSEAVVIERSLARFARSCLDLLGEGWKETST